MSDPGSAEISSDAKVDFLHQFHIGEIRMITATMKCKDKENYID